MPQPPVVLRAGSATVTVDPDDGARVRSWTLDGHELLVDGHGGGWRYGAFVMAPWAGRIRDAVAAWNGLRRQYPRQEDGHGLHGLVHSARWSPAGPSSWSIEVAGADPSGAADLSVDPAPGAALDDGWLAPLRLTQHLDLHADHLRVDLEVSVPTPVPVTVGWHPWFRRRVAGADARVELAAGAMLARDAAGITTAERVAVPPGPWDDTFVDLHGPIAIRWGEALHLEIEHDGPATVVFTGEDRGVCVEPQTGPPDEVNQAPRVVTPEQPLRLTSTWRWRWL